MLGLGLAAVLLYTIHLGDLPLRDWDEGTVAQVARDIWRSHFTGNPSPALTWLYPTIGGVPYQNKPILMHSLIAFSYAVGGVNEWSARLPGALLSALSVPLLYGIGREIFSRRISALFSALVYLTLLPVLRHGRLAMLDGALVCFFLVMMYCVLRSRRDLRWSWGIGLGFGLMCLAKGAIGLLLGAIAVIFLAWDTPRLLTVPHLWGGMVLGSVPVFGWYWAQWARYGVAFLGTNLGDQTFRRLWESVEGHQGPVWFYLVELLKYTAPWLLFLPQGFQLAWENRGLSWAKLGLVWFGTYLLVISLMQTKLPWYVMPLYPALAMVTGHLLANIWDTGDVTGIRYEPSRGFPRWWSGLLGGLAIAAWGFSFYFITGPMAKPDLSIILDALALTFTIATILMIRRNSQFIPVLFWGCYVSLLFLIVSPYWLWELEESYPVKPVAELIRKNTPPGTAIITSYPHGRPSLNFYSDRLVVPTASNDEIVRHWQTTPTPYLLIQSDKLQQLNAQLNPQPTHPLGEAQGWQLVTRKP
jgi:4-amino-4-deoxy-L-arabinose transferase-like glycosyltransferase